MLRISGTWTEITQELAALKLTLTLICGYRRSNRSNNIKGKPVCGIGSATRVDANTNWVAFKAGDKVADDPKAASFMALKVMLITALQPLPITFTPKAAHRLLCWRHRKRWSYSKKWCFKSWNVTGANWGINQYAGFIVDIAL